ncbi:AAA family ATPase [Patescibacteria group bacterium]
MHSQIIIGITGTNGSGKTSVVRYLANKHNFKHFSAGEYFANELRKLGKIVNRDNQINMANNLRKKHGPDFVAKTLGGMAINCGRNAVIESLRNSREVEGLRKLKNFHLIAVDANHETRYRRIVKRKSAKDRVSYDEFLTTEKREMRSDKTHEENMAKCIEMADFMIENNGTLDELHESVENIINKIINA